MRQLCGPALLLERGGLGVEGAGENQSSPHRAGEQEGRWASRFSRCEAGGESLTISRPELHLQHVGFAPVGWQKEQLLPAQSLEGHGGLGCPQGRGGGRP